MYSTDVILQKIVRQSIVARGSACKGFRTFFEDWLSRSEREGLFRPLGLSSSRRVSRRTRESGRNARPTSTNEFCGSTSIGVPGIFATIAAACAGEVFAGIAGRGDPFDRRDCIAIELFRSLRAFKSRSNILSQVRVQVICTVPF